MKAEDNPYPYITLVETTTPAAPAAGRQKAFVDSADHKFKRVNSSGAVTTIEGGSGGGTTDTWHNVATFSGTWVNYGGAEQVAGYMIDGAGNVHLRGTIKSGTIGTVAFVLPAGYRPSSTMHFPAITNNGTAIVFGQVSALTDGSVGVYVGSNTYVRLDGLSFPTA